MVPTERDAHRGSRLLTAIAAMIFALSVLVLVLWLVLSDQKTKLYEADNVVCASQPFAMACFERKPR